MQYETPERSSIKTYALVGFIFYLLVTIGWLLILLLVVLLIPWSRIPPPGPNFPIPIPYPNLVVSMLGIPIILLSIIFTGLAFSTYKKIDEGRYMNARTPSLILGIFGLLPFFGGFLGGIFFLLAYGNLGDTQRMTHRIPPTVHPSSTTQIPSRRSCASCGEAIDSNDRFCAKCGAKLT